MNKWPTFLALAWALVWTCPPAYAHGGAKHETAPIIKEQKSWGIAGDPVAVTRTVTLRMTDNMRFTPDLVRVKQGETVRFVLHNEGVMLHEMVIGTRAVLQEHAALMRKFPEMEHDEPYMAHVDPGKTGEILWRFNRAGDFEFACLIPGHYEGGMRGRILVRK
ncbi:MAG: cupredoxin family protein [Thiobacillus sp.]|nr:cupredoxin family protein [Thiobacillus sp.]